MRVARRHAGGGSTDPRSVPRDDAFVFFFECFGSTETIIITARRFFVRRVVRVGRIRVDKRRVARRRGVPALGGERIFTNGIFTTGGVSSRRRFVPPGKNGKNDRFRFDRGRHRGRDGHASFATSPGDPRGAVVAPGGRDVRTGRDEKQRQKLGSVPPGDARDFFPRRRARFAREREREPVARRALGPRARRARDRRAVRAPKKRGRKKDDGRRVVAPGIGFEGFADSRALARRAMGRGEPWRDGAFGRVPRERLQAGVRRDDRRLRVPDRRQLRVCVSPRRPLGGRAQLPRVFRDLRHRRRRRVRARRVLEEKREEREKRTRKRK